MYEYKGHKIELIGHDSVKIITPSGKVIYFDPFANPQRGYDVKADYVFISHEHFDHCDVNVLKSITTSSTIILAPPRCKEMLSDVDGKLNFLSAGDVFDDGFVKCKAVHAYNIGKPYHPKGLGNGYVVEVEGVRYYHPGDTDFIPEMENLQGKVDVFFVPISGVYVMDENDALKAVGVIKPKIVIPMHYNYLEGLNKDPHAFKQNVENRIEDVEVVVLLE